MYLKVIAHAYTPFPEKFGVPRQSGMVEGTKGKIIFEPEYRNPDALRGLEGFSHIWIIWDFDKVKMERWSPTVRPPRLGGNSRMGVFATRSPFRPNPIGLSSVKIEKIYVDKDLGPIIEVSGIDLVDQTPIYDIKPYIKYCDSHEEALGGFVADHPEDKIQIEFPNELLSKIPKEDQEGLIGVLEQDPRPRYQEDEHRRYGLSYGSRNISFVVHENKLVVLEVSET